MPIGIPLWVSISLSILPALIPTFFAIALWRASRRAP